MPTTLTPQQRYMAAAHRAAGLPSGMVASMLGLEREAFEEVDGEAGFAAMVEECRGFQAMPEDTWRDMAHRLIRTSLIDALVHRRPGAVGHAIRLVHPGAGHGTRRHGRWAQGEPGRFAWEDLDAKDMPPVDEMLKDQYDAAYATWSDEEKLEFGRLGWTAEEELASELAVQVRASLSAQDPSSREGEPADTLVVPDEVNPGTTDESPPGKALAARHVTLQFNDRPWTFTDLYYACMPIATRLLDREAEWHEANATGESAAASGGGATPGPVPFLPAAVRAAEGRSAARPSDPSRSAPAGPVAEEPPAPRPLTLLTSTELRARIEALLRQDAARDAADLDLANAVCAVRWRNWPSYRGPIDGFVLRDALRGLEIDPRDLNRLASRAFAAPVARHRPSAWPAAP